MGESIRIYEVKGGYIGYLSNYQKHIFAQTEGKEKRKYIGIILTVRGMNYFAPLR